MVKDIKNGTSKMNKFAVTPIQSGMPSPLQSIRQMFNGKANVTKGGWWYLNLSNRVNTQCRKFKTTRSDGQIEGVWKFIVFQYGDEVERDLSFDDASALISKLTGITQ